jgi:carboxypeptidase C (cathepsin A)
MFKRPLPERSNSWGCVPVELFLDTEYGLPERRTKANSIRPGFRLCRAALIVCLASAWFPATLPAAEAGANPPPGSTNAPAKEAPREKAKEPEEKLVQSQHAITIAGHPISYTASAGTILLRNEEDKPTASIFYIAYNRDNAGAPSARPITFSFNGGPGSASVWMHLGMLGPRRVHLLEDGASPPPPYSLEDNDQSLLEETDLVFIDPVGTGYSRAIPPGDARKFYGLREDAASVAEFIRLFVTRNKRWNSPKFIIGESYGTTRAAALSGELSQRLKMNVNGIMLVSTVLNFQTIDFSQGNDLPYILYLPSYTATAWFHKKLSPELERQSLPDVVARAESFASGDYSSALFSGSSLPAAQRRKVAEQYARLTGLTTNYVERANLRVTLNRFAGELLADDNRVIGRYDGRYKGYVRDRLAGRMEQDPSFEAVASAFASTFNDYVRTELKYESDLSYEVLASVGSWNWEQSNGYVDVGETLASALTRNPFLKVHVSSGYYDLATPLFAARYTFNHLNVDPALLGNITLDSYNAGHMMYLNLPDLKKSKTDLARFIRSAVPNP